MLEINKHFIYNFGIRKILKRLKKKGENIKMRIKAKNVDTVRERERERERAIL